MATVRSILLDVVAESRGAQRSLHEISEEIRGLPSGAEFNITADTQKARRRLQEMENELRKIDRREVSPEISADISQALVQIELLSSRLNKLPRKQTIDVEVRRGVLGEVADVERAVVRLASGLERGSRPARTFGDVMGDTIQTVKSVTPVLNGLSILIGIKLVSGLLAVGASALSAVGGIMALGAAFAAALGPAVVLAIGFFNRLAKVLEALKAQDDARDAAARRGAAGSAAARAAADQRRQAEEGLRDALQTVTTAERNLATAREGAADAIEAANEQVVAAQHQVGQSAQDVADATVDAYRAMEDAAERVSDAIRDVAAAELGLDEARLGIREAQLALKEFRRDTGLTGDIFDSLFKKFTDVDVDFDASVFQDALKQQAGGLTEDDQLRFERLVLAVRDAKLKEKQATDGVSDSERDLKRARQENARFMRDGIDAHRPLVAALEAARSSQEALAKATEHANDLERQGIEQSPQVIAAREALRDAEERLAESRRRRQQVQSDPALLEQQLRAEQLTDKLTDAERRFLDVLKQVRTELSGFLTPALDAVFDGVTRAFGRAPALLLPLKDAFTGLGDAWGEVIDRFSQALIQPQNIAALRSFITSSATLARILAGDAFMAFLAILRNIALVAMPLLIEVSRELAGWLREVADATTGAKAAPWINAMVESFRTWMRLLGAVGGALLEIIRVAAPFGDELVQWITDAVNAFREWLGTAEGQKEVARFFEDTLPSVKSLLKFLFLLAKIALRLIQFVSPFLDGAISGLNFILGLLDTLLGWLNKIVGNPWGRAIRYAIGQFFGLGGILRLFGRLVGFIGGLPGLLSRVGGRVGSYLLAPFRQAGNAILGIFTRLAPNLAGRIGSLASRGAAAATSRVGEWIAAGGRLIRGLISGVLSRAAGLLDAGRRLIGRLLGGVRARAGEALRAGQDLVVRIARGIAGFMGRVYQAGASVVRRLVDGARSLLGHAYNLGAALLDGLVRGFTTIGRAVYDAIKGLGQKIVDAVKAVLGIHSPSRVMQRLGEFMLAGLIKGFTSGDIVGFIRDHLGGIPGLALELAKAGLVDLPLAALDKLADLAGKGLDVGVNAAKDLIPGLARGGLARAGTDSIRRVGDGPYDEAVLPLSKAVMRRLANAIAQQMRFSAPMALAGAGGRVPLAAPMGGRVGTIIEKQDVHLPPAPGHDQLGDVRHQANEFAREMARRGGGRVGR